MLFAAPVVIYLKKQSLEIYYPKLEPGVLELPLTQYRFLEVISLEEFKQSIIDFLGNLSLKNKKTVIALSPETTFENQFEYPQPPADLKDKDKIAEAKQQAVEELNKAIETFINLVPLEDSQKGVKKLSTGNGETVVVFNKETLLHLQEVLTSFEPEIEAVVPAALLGLEPHEGFLSPSEIGTLTQKNKTTKQINLLEIIQAPLPQVTQAPTLDEEEIEERQSSNRNKWVLAFIVVLFVGIAVAYFFWGERMRPKILPRLLKTASSSAVPATASPSPSAVASAAATLDKAVVEIEVLNGSGVRGQAARMEEVLKDLGYIQIETGNATSSAQETVVSFSTAIPSFERGEIITSLAQIYSVVKDQEIARSVGSDIQIVLGALK